MGMPFLQALLRASQGPRGQAAGDEGGFDVQVRIDQDEVRIGAGADDALAAI
jgi:hypothetical protein